MKASFIDVETVQCVIQINTNISNNNRVVFFRFSRTQNVTASISSIFSLIRQYPIHWPNCLNYVSGSYICLNGIGTYGNIFTYL